MNPQTQSHTSTTQQQQAKQPTVPAEISAFLENLKKQLDIFKDQATQMQDQITKLAPSGQQPAPPAKTE